jgi:hypothetical protein
VRSRLQPVAPRRCDAEGRAAGRAVAAATLQARRLAHAIAAWPPGGPPPYRARALLAAIRALPGGPAPAYYCPCPSALEVNFKVQQPVDLLDNFGTSRLVLLMCVCWPACCISACPPLVVPGIALPAPLPHSCAGRSVRKKTRLLVVLAAFRVGSGNRLLVDLAAAP